MKKANARAFSNDAMKGEWQPGRQDGEATQPVPEQEAGGGTSIFDPVLCELVYRWFSPEGGLVLDPFAGGSVRGVVAAVLGRRYVGMELRGEQVEANRQQWVEIMGGGPTLISDPQALTPIEQRANVLVKRDDLFGIGGVQGGKVRTCYALAQGAEGGLITAGSRASPQVNIVAHVAAHLGLKARCHTPNGALSPEVQAAREIGAEIVQHKAGYNNVIIARAREDAAATGWKEIPFGMECEEAIKQTRRQVQNVPVNVQRIIMPCGSGMSLAGVLHGLDDCDLGHVQVAAVVVGADPTARLNKYAPANWKSRVQLIQATTDYHKPAIVTALDGLELDAHYEAKCLPHLQPGDLLWVVGIRATATGHQDIAGKPEPVWHQGDSTGIDALGVEADLVFSCPPYADLERYSDDPADLSVMAYPEFLVAYRTIIAKACAQLKPDRFACFVVGEVRDAKGNYRNLVGDTVEAFKAAGLAFYNEAILVTAVGSLPIRVGQQFIAGRKLGKTHQNVLVFVKGDGKKAAQACGTITVPGSDMVET